MSKSNNNDSDISSKYIEFLINAIGDTNTSIQALSNNYKNSLREQRKNYEDLIKAFNKGEISSDKLAKGFAQALKTVQSVDYGMRRTERYNDSAKDFFDKLAKEIDGKKITETLLDKIESALTNLDMTALTQSYKENEKGTKNALFKNVKDNDKLKDVNTDLANKIGAKLDDVTFKLMSFLGQQDKERTKKTRGFVDDLIEGLAKNKFIGGAIKDTITLLGLLGGTWLSKHFGKLGDILAGGFFALTQVIATILPALIIGGIANIFTGGKLFGFMAKGGLNLIKSLGGAGGKGLKASTTATKALDAGTMRYLMFPKATDVTKSGLDIVKGAGATAKVANVAKTGLTLGKAIKGVPGVGALFEVLGDIPALIDAKKQRGGAFGKQVLKTGGGAVGTIVGGMLGSALGPLGTIIGSIVGGWIGRGIGMLIGAVGDWFKKLFRLKDDETKQNEGTKGFWEGFVEWFKDTWEHRPKILGGKGRDYESNQTQQEMGDNATVGKVSGLGKRGTTAQLLTGKHKSAFNKHLDLKKMTEADWQKADTLEPVYGSMGEILNLGQMSQKRAKEVVEADIKAKGNKSFYEALDKNLINKGSFGTDIPYAARGTSEKFKDMLARLEGAGFDTSGIKITSAIGTLGSRAGMSPHSYTDSIRGHFSSYGTTIDTSSIYNRKTGKRLTQADLNAIGLGAYWLNSEKDHEHIALGQLQWQKDLLNPKAVAQQHSIDAKSVLARLDAEKQKEIERKGKEYNISSEEVNKMYEDELLKRKIYSPKEGTWVQETAAGTKVLSWDAPGNRTAQNMTILGNIANVGVNN
jgi:hypothetical protein